MSYVSQFERRARQSTAISMLNGLRHLLLGRAAALDPGHLAILKSASEMSLADQLSAKMVQCSFRSGTGDSAATLELSDAMRIALFEIEGTSGVSLDLTESLRRAAAHDFNIESADEREELVRLTTTAMDVISSRERYEAMGAFSKGSVSSFLFST